MVGVMRFEPVSRADTVCSDFFVFNKSFLWKQRDEEGRRRGRRKEG